MAAPLLGSLILVVLAVAPGTATAFPDPDCSSGPTIRGTTRVGQTLTGNQAPCTGIPSPRYSWSWHRCDTTGGPCVLVGLRRTYTVTPNELGKLLELTRTASNGLPPNDVASTFSARIKGRPPRASFAASPNPVEVAKTLTLDGSGSTDPDGQALSYRWDLDGNGSFETNTGSTPRASKTFSTTGDKTVSLRVTDTDGDTGVTFGTVSVDSASAPPRPKPQPRLRLLRPFPRVAIAGFVTARWTRLTLFRVTAPRLTRVLVRCYGRGCPRGTTRARVGRRRAVLLRTFRRRFRPGAVIKVYVWKKNRIGKYTRFAFLRNRPPARRDRCIEPVHLRRTRCR